MALLMLSATIPVGDAAEVAVGEVTECAVDELFSFRVQPDNPLSVLLKAVNYVPDSHHVMLKLDHIQLPVWTISKCKKLRGKYFGAFPVVAVHSPIAIDRRIW